MKNRCNNENYPDFHRYGGRGISYDKKWETFGGFFDDMYRSYLLNVKNFGEKNTTLDRKNNDLGYNKLNCHWATAKEQAINRRHTRLVEYNGIKKTLTDWAIQFNIKRSTIYQRFHAYKWPIDKCLTK